MFSYPLTWFVASFVGLRVAAEVGVYLRGKRAYSEGVRDDLKLVLSATLTLLALIIGFSFSMAGTRFEQRRTVEEQEANAIGTEYLRVSLLPAPEAARAHALLREYVDQRIRFYTTRPSDELNDLDAATLSMQNAMWDVVKKAAVAKPTPVTALVASGMNDVIDAQGFTTAAWINLIPPAAWLLLLSIAFGCCALLGFLRQQNDRSRSVFLMPLVIAISIYLIADLASPRAGIINTPPNNMQSVKASMH